VHNTGMITSREVHVVISYVMMAYNQNFNITALEELCVITQKKVQMCLI
jgi:hypothetical protein